MSELPAATYSFNDGTRIVNLSCFVWQPSKAWEWIQQGLSLAYPLPQFEAGDAASAFIQANRNGMGDCMINGNPRSMIVFQYDVSVSDGIHMVAAWLRTDNGAFLEYYGTLSDMREWGVNYNATPL